MAGNIPFNTNLDVDGLIKVTNVPNATGTLLTYNTSNKTISTRTNSQILTDLGLSTTVSNTHTHSNLSVLNGITSTKVDNWDFAYGYASIGHLRLSGGVINGNTYNMLGLTGTNATGGASIVFANASASPGILGKLGFRNDGQFVMSKGTTTDGTPDLLSIDANGLLELYSNLKFNGVDSSLIDRTGNIRFRMSDTSTVISANNTYIYLKAGGENSSSQDQVIIDNKGVITGKQLGGSWLVGHTTSMGIKFNAPLANNTYSGWIAQKTYNGGSWGIGLLGESFYVSYISPANISSNTNAPVHPFRIDNDASVNLISLSGSGTRMVVADANGKLSTQAIPSGGGSGSFMPLNTGRPSNNMETLRTSGIYGGGEGASETTNRPSGSYGYSPYMVMQSGTDRFVQMWFDAWSGNNDKDTIRYRSGSSTQWGIWRSMWHDGHFTQSNINNWNSSSDPNYVRSSMASTSIATTGILKVKLGRTTFSGWIRLRVTGGWSGANANGLIEISGGVGANTNSIWNNQMKCTESTGATRTQFYINPTILVDTDGQLYFEVHKKSAASNPIYVDIELHANVASTSTPSVEWASSGTALTITNEVELQGGLTVGALSGSGTRMVVVNANGVLSSQTIPSGGGSSGGDTNAKTISLDPSNLDGVNRNGFIHKNSYGNIYSEESDQTGLLLYGVRSSDGRWYSPFDNPSEFYGKMGVRFYDVSDYTTQGTVLYSSGFSAELDYYAQLEKIYLIVYYDPENDISQSGWFNFEEFMVMKKACYGENRMMCLLGKMILEDNIHSIDVDPKYF